MSLVRMLPLATMVGVGYTQKDQLGDVMQAPINIAKVAATQHEMTNIRTAFRLDMITDNLPRNVLTKDGFSDYIENRFHSDGRSPAIDFWGKPYRIKEWPDEYEFWSHGPDGIDDTEDDVWAALPKAYGEGFEP